MEIQVRTLREALELLKPVVPKKPTLEVLNNVLLQDGRLRATDLDVGVILEISTPDGSTGSSQAGDYLLPYQKGVGLLKRGPGHETLTIARDGKTLNLSWADGQATFDTEATPQDFPPFPVPEDKVTATIDGDTLIPAMAALTAYAAQDDGRPTLAGVTLLLGDELRLAAADGFRLAYKTLPTALKADGMETAIIPTHSVHVLEHLSRKALREAPQVGTLAQLLTAKRKLELKMDKSTLQIRFGKVTMTTRLITGAPPNYVSLIPKETIAEVMVMAPELDRAVRSVLGVAKETTSIVRLSWSKQSMKVQSKGEDSIEVTVSVVSATPSRVALNISYVLDYLRDKSSVVKMALSGGGPVTFMYGNAPLVLIMPMDVRWGDEPTPEPASANAPQAQSETETEASLEVTEDTAENGESETPDAEAEAEKEATPSEPEPKTAKAAQAKAKKPRKKKVVKA